MLTPAQLFLAKPAMKLRRRAADTPLVNKYSVKIAAIKLLMSVIGAYTCLF